MTVSGKLIGGAVITFFALVGVIYSITALSNAATNKQVAFKESDVKTIPGAMKIYVPIVAGSTIALIVGIALVGYGVSETLTVSPPSSIEKQEDRTSKQAKRSGTADAA
jgi:hypothetical protein